MRKLLAFLVGSTALFLGHAPVWAASLPTLPQTFIDTTYAPPSGNTITVNAGGNFQAALNSAALGDTIVLQAGVTFTGPFTLPNKPGSGWIYIRGSAYSSLPPPGTRVTPADAANMPKIQVVTSLGGAIQTSSGAHHYRFVGIELKPVTGNYVNSLVAIGNGETSTSNLPRDITFDRCYVHGDPAVGGRRGIAMNGIRVAVVDSHLSDFKEMGNDTQALWAYNTPGPLKVVNNYLEAAGENLMTGGADPAIANLVPSDIEIRGNHFFKPLAWINQAWTVKNLLEFKTGQRILVEGNTFENNWAAGQVGFAILLSPRNQDGGAPWTVVQDVTIRLNKLINVGQGVTISGRDSPNTSQTTRRILVENNTLQVSGLQGAAARIFQVVGGPIDTTIRHNTGVITAAVGTAAFSENNPGADQFDFRDNLLSRGIEGFKGTGTGEGTPTLIGYFTNYTFLKNALIGPAGGSYPASNFFPADNSAAGFVNVAGGDYRLVSSSPYRGAASDGKDVGADIAAIQAATASIDPLADTDNDSVPYAVELSEGLNPSLKDNDIFASARLFGMQQYRDFLAREGDAAGVNYYAQQIGSSALSRAQVVEAFTNSPEFQSGMPQCTRLYFSFFGRIPDYAGLLFQVAQYRAGVPLEIIAQNFVNSPEFTSRYGALNNDQFINLVYWNVLGRAPDAAGYNYYGAHLDSGAITRGMMMVGFSESPEFTGMMANEVFVVAVYVGTLRRTPDSAGLALYTNTLDGGGSRTQVVGAFIGSPEYRGRFLP